MNIRKYIIKSSATGILNSAVSAGTVIVLLPIIINKIGLEQYGIWATLNIFLGMANLVDMGVSRSLAHFIPNANDLYEKDEYYSSGIVINVGTSIIVVVTCFVVYIGGFRLWGGDSNITDELNDFILLAGFSALIIRVWSQFLKGVLEGCYELTVVNVSNMITTVLTHLGLLFFVVIGNPKIEYLVISTLAVHVIVNIFLFFGIKKSSGLSVVVPRKKNIKEILGFALKSMPIGLVDNLMAAGNRLLFMRFGGSAEAYGLFEFLMKVAVTAKALLTTFSQPLFSIFSQFGVENIKKINEILATYRPRLLAAFIGGLLVYAIVGEEILVSFLGENELDYDLLAYICIFGVSFAGVAEPYLRALLALRSFRVAFFVKLMVPVFYGLILMIMLHKGIVLALVSAFAGTYFVNSLLYIGVYEAKYRYRII